MVNSGVLEMRDISRYPQGWRNRGVGGGGGGGGGASVGDDPKYSKCGPDKELSTISLKK